HRITRQRLLLRPAFWQTGWTVKENWLSGAFLPADLRELHPVDVNFQRLLQLTGVRLIRDAACLVVHLPWRALENPTRRWRCLRHLRWQDHQISSLDHELLRGHPPLTRWEAEDEGYESLRLWLASPPEDLKLRLGLFDPAINVRSAVLASTLPIADESSAVWIDTNPASRGTYAIRFDPPPLIPARVVFERGFELAAYSIAPQGDLICL